MFNLSKEVNRLQQLKYDKIHGLLHKRKTHDLKIQHIDGNVFEVCAEQEGAIVIRSFHNHSLGFGRRLSKRKGQYHKPGGGYAGHSVKGE